MGVHGTFCQLCGLPTQHDHYVPTASRMLKIYRGSAPGGGHSWAPGERPFAFGPEHAWLADAVVLPWDDARVLRGAIKDGALEDVMVFEGGDDGLAFHHACWVLQGSPGSTGPAVRSNGAHGWALVESYHEQLFDFASLEADGKAWMLADPTRDARSRARIEALLAVARVEVGDPPPGDVVGILRADRDWAALSPRDGAGRRRAILRARTYTMENVDKAGYADLVRVSRHYEREDLPAGDAMQALEAFECALKAAVERDAGAILVLVAIARDRAEFLAWARDGRRTRAIIEALPGARGYEVDVTADPAWNAAMETVLRYRR